MYTYVYHISVYLREISKGLLGPDELINKLKEMENIQEQTKQDFSNLSGTIGETGVKISQVSSHLLQIFQDIFKKPAFM